MSSSDKSLYRFYTSQTLSTVGATVNVSKYLNPDGTTSATDASFTDASLVIRNDKGTRVELMIGTATGWVLTLSKRGLDNTDTVTEVPGNKLSRLAGSLVYVTKLAFDIIDKDANNTFAGDNTFTGKNDFNATTKPGLKVPRVTTAQRTGMTAEEGTIVADTDTGLPYMYIGGAWYPFATGSTQPNASTTTAGKAQVSTQSHFDAGTDLWVTGAYNIPTNSEIQKMVNTATAKTTVVDTDQMLLADSADSNKNKKITWTNTKTQLLTDLPSSETSWWLIERATDIEAATWADTTRFVTAKQMKDVAVLSCSSWNGTHDTSVTGTQTIAHLLTKTPKLVKITALLSWNDKLITSFGTYSWGAERSTVQYYENATWFKISSQQSFIAEIWELWATGAICTASCTVDATNITLTRAKNWSPTWTTVFLREAYS